MKYIALIEGGIVVKRLLSLATLTAIVSLALVACGSPPPAPAATPTPISTSPAPPPPAPTPTAALPTAAPNQGGGANGGGTEFEVTLEDPAGAGEYGFSPADMTFKVGDTVSFTFMAESEFHTFTVDDLDINVDVEGESTETLTFTFDKTGTFKLICVPHESLGMVGTITVQ